MRTTSNRRLAKARKQRNQRILWVLQDIFGLACIGGTAYGIALIMYAVHGSI
jgi:hypothetical protein